MHQAAENTAPGHLENQIRIEIRQIGIPILMIACSEYREILGQANEGRVQTFTSGEDRQLSVNHATVGAKLAESSLLPDEIVFAIYHHHDVGLIGTAEAPGIPAVSWTMIAIAQLAEHLMQSNTGLAQTNEWKKVAEIALEEQGLNDRDLANLEEESATVLRDHI